MKKGLVLVALAAILSLGAWAMLEGNSSTSTRESNVPGTQDNTAQIHNETLRLPNAEPIKRPDGVRDDSYLWAVVNKKRPIQAEHYRPSKIVIPNIPVRADKSTDERSVDARIKEPLEKFITAANSQGLKVMVASGFRSYEQQKTYFDNYTRIYGLEAANRFSARPSQSEHQLGTSVDISYQDQSNCYIELCFADTAAGRWLAEHALEYGFILRYPKDKTSQTGYQYEPWHFRYVGVELAKALRQSALSLDEAAPYIYK